MRLWSIHPKYLDAIGLVALWRESLLARKVLQGRTRGYRHHPQLIRFQERTSPVASINSYLRAVWLEADRRGYSFDKRKLGTARRAAPLDISREQLQFELAHLRRKLQKRDKEQYARIARVKTPAPHPLFRARKGAVAAWEKRTALPRPKERESS